MKFPLSCPGIAILPVALAFFLSGLLLNADEFVVCNVPDDTYRDAYVDSTTFVNDDYVGGDLCSGIDGFYGSDQVSLNVGSISSGGRDRKMVMAFKLPELGGGRVVGRAVLRIWLTASVNPSSPGLELGDVSVFYSTTHNDGYFSVSDYDASSWTDSGLNLGLSNASAFGYYEVDVSRIVAAEYLANDNVISFRLEMDNTAAFYGSGVADFYSIRGGDATIPDRIPALVLNTTSESAAR
ncbi:hypothetical protein ACWPKO_15780 [Coraliomargarita sp. W4R53]